MALFQKRIQCRLGKIYLFADDTVLVVKGKNIESAVMQANIDLGNINKWFNINKMKINPLKTEYMILQKKKTYALSVNVKIGNNIIQRVEHVKYLGVYIDENLNFDKHVEVVGKKLSSKINFMKRISRRLTFHTKKTIYNSIVLPHFSYCSTMLINCNKEQLKLFQKLQNLAMRIILNCEFRTHTADMLDALNWLSVNQKINYDIILYVFKIKNEMTPRYLSNKLKYARDMHNRNTRSNNELRLPRFNSEFSRRNIFYNGVKMYNELPNVMKNENSLVRFKKLLFEYVKTNVTR